MRVRTAERGFTLIEIMAAITVFSIVTLGLVPLLGASLRGTSLAQSETVAQNSAREMMERIQGLKWFTSWNAKPSKVDVLDLYYPQVSPTGLLAGQSYATVTSYPPLTLPGGSAGVFTTQCPAAANPACQGNLPAGYTMTIRAAFVRPNAGTSPQTYQIVTPGADYAYNSTSGKDAPPAQLLHVDVAVTRTVNGRTRTSKLQSIVGERKFTPPAAVVGTAPPSATPAAPPGAAKISATAKLDYAYQIQTGFSSSSTGTGCPTAPCASDFEATILNGESVIDSSDTVSAASTVRTAQLSVVRSYPPPQTPPASPPPDLAALSGIAASAYAPPTLPAATSCTPAPPNCNTNTNLTHPDFSGPPVIATLGGTRVNTISADIPGGNPTTNADFRLNNSCGAIDASFTHNQADLASTGYLRLSSSTPVNLVRTNSSTSCSLNPDERTRGTTLATATALTPSATRNVQSKATASVYQLSWHRINYAGAPFLLNLLGFKATVDCKSTPSGGAYGTASWSTQFLYRFDHTDNNNVPSSLLGMTANLSSTGNDTITGKFDGVNTTTVTTPNAIDWLKANNPLVYDGNSVCCTTTSDIYLFTEKDSSGNLLKKGYLNGAFELKNPQTTVSADGRTTSASIDAALRFDTNQQHASYPDSAYNISVGKLGCEAVDNR